jgi:hypothetical protein
MIIARVLCRSRLHSLENLSALAAVFGLNVRHSVSGNISQFDHRHCREHTNTASAPFPILVEPPQHSGSYDGSRVQLLQQAVFLYYRLCRSSMPRGIFDCAIV